MLWQMLRVGAGQRVANLPIGPEKKCYCEDRRRCFSSSSSSSFSPLFHDFSLFLSSFFLNLSFLFFVLVFDRLGRRSVLSREFQAEMVRRERAKSFCVMLLIRGRVLGDFKR